MSAGVSGWYWRASDGWMNAAPRSKGVARDRAQAQAVIDLN
jgi:hypothetical protein